MSRPVKEIEGGVYEALDNAEHDPCCGWAPTVSGPARLPWWSLRPRRRPTPQCSGLASPAAERAMATAGWSCTVVGEACDLQAIAELSSMATTGVVLAPVPCASDSNAAAPTGRSICQATIAACRSEEHTSELQSLAYLVCR